MKMIDHLRPDAFSDITLDEIDRAHDWINRDGAPRDECFMSSGSEPYTYGSGRGVRTYHPISFSPLIEKIRNRILDMYGVEYEVCFSNKYVDQHKHLGWHADDSPSIDHNYGIVIVSFGSERAIWFRENGAGFDSVEKVSLPHGSSLMMPAGFQSTHQHKIPKHPRPCGTRISLTWRKLCTN